MSHLIFISHSSKDAPIAQLICHRLEEAGIPCWIAPRDIKSIDWAGSIMDGLQKSDVCVVIISSNSIDSGEVTKEITEATRTCDFIIPFKMDEEALRINIRFHGENSRQTFYARETIADLAATMGDKEKAAGLYTELEIEMEQDFGENNPYLDALREKRKANM